MSNNFVHVGSEIKSMEVGNMPDTPEDVIEKYIEELDAKKYQWAQGTSLDKKIKLLEETLANVQKYNDEWTELDLKARHIPEGHPETAYSQAQGFASTLAIKKFLNTLYKIKEHGGNKPFVKASQVGNRVVVESFPLDEEDKANFPGVEGQIHLMEGTTLEDLPSLQAKLYKDKSFKGGISLVLAAGNVACIAIHDFLHKMYLEGRVIVIKNNPVLEYMGPLLEKILEPYIKEGFVRVVVGGAKEGRHLSSHPLIDEIHVTGSDKTFESIVFGPGEEGQDNKHKGIQVNDKVVTAELGNVSPVIVVPGDWKESDYDAQAEKILPMFNIVNSYACLAMRVLVLPKNWEGSSKLLAKLKEKLSQMAAPVNYYPGTDNTIKEAMAVYPNANVYGKLETRKQPIIFVEGLDAAEDELAFKREFWGSFTSQTYIDAPTKDEYLMKAVDFVNNKLWGTLSAAIIIDPQSENELKKKETLQKAVNNLRYGTVAINTGAATSWFLGVNPWGGYPGSNKMDIQSGNIFTINPLMLDKVEKSIVKAPF